MFTIRGVLINKLVYLIVLLLLIIVLLYLVMFRLEELGISEFRKFVLTQRLRKMHKVCCGF